MFARYLNPSNYPPFANSRKENESRTSSCTRTTLASRTILPKRRLVKQDASSIQNTIAQISVSSRNRYLVGNPTNRLWFSDNPLFLVSPVRLELSAFGNYTQACGSTTFSGKSFCPEARMVRYSGGKSWPARDDITFCGMGFFACCRLRPSCRTWLPVVRYRSMVSPSVCGGKWRLRFLWNG